MLLAWVAVMMTAGPLQMPLPLRTGDGAAPTPIIGGEPVVGKDWSNVVAVLSVDPTDASLGHLCSGTLIAPKIVLTAAHCIVPGTDVAKISVFFGTEMTRRQEASVTRFGIYPGACVKDCEGDAFDFAFVEIRETVGGVDIIPLLTTQEEWDEAVAPKRPITLVGFGAVRDDEEDGEPPLKDSERGFKRVVETQIEKLRPGGRELVAGSPGRDTCGGDSGGPAFVQLADGSWRQLGVTSRGVRPCGTGRGYYGVPYFALTWLREEAGLDLLPADCQDGDCIDTRPPEEGCGCRSRGEDGPWAMMVVMVVMVGMMTRRRRVSS